jgi:aspartate ammonia-lyase
MVTVLALLTGYDAARIADEAVATAKSVRQLAQLKKVLPQDQLDSVWTLEHDHARGEVIAGKTVFLL